MPIFQYDAYRNAYGPSIAEALAHQGDPAAAAALRSGDIEARAAQQQGLLRAQQFSALGAIPEQIAAQRDAQQTRQARAQQLEIGGLQLDAAKRDAKTRNVMDAELRNPANRNPDGSLNDDRFMQALQQQDVGAWQQYGALAAKNTQARLELLKTTSEIKKNVTDADEKAQKVRDAQIAYLSKGALSAYDALQQKPEDPLHARDTANSYVADGIASGAITATQGQQFLLRTAQAGPDQLAGTFLQMTDPEMRAKVAKEQAEARKPINVGAGDTLVNPPNPATPGAPPTVYFTGTPKDEHSPIYKEWQDDVANGGTLTFDQYQTKDANRHRPVTTINTGTTTVPGDFAQTGPAFLDTIPAQWRTTVKKIAAYDEDPTKVTSMRGGMRETVMQWVNQVNPAYDATRFSVRGPTRQAFTTGTQGKQITNINTAIGHIDQLTGLADQLQNGGFVPANQAWNAIRTAFGADQVTNFDTLKDALAGEVAGVLSQSGATVSGIAEAREKIKASNSPTQLAGYVKTLIPVMGSKLGSLDYQYHQAMGETDPFSALSPESRRILTKHGVDPAHVTGGAPSAVVAAPALPTKGEKRTDAATGETRVWDGLRWQPLTAVK